MKSPRARVACPIFILFLLLHGPGEPLRAVWADDWLQFRGPSGQGIVAGDLPVRWTEKVGIQWKTPLSGRSHSSPVICGDEIWLSTATADGSLLGALCLHRETGVQLRSVVAFEPAQREPLHADNTYASPTPCLRDGRLYLDFGTYGVACVETRTAQVLWRNTELAIDHQGGAGSSPLLFEDTLIIHRDGADQQYAAALDIATGKVLWKSPRCAPQRSDPVVKRAFSTPCLWSQEGVPILICAAADQVLAINARTGIPLWWVRYTGYSVVPRPVTSGELVYICTGFDAHELLAIRRGGHGDVTDSHIAWRYTGQVPTLSSPLARDDRLYFVSDGGVLTSLNALTGNKLLTKRLGGSFTASPICAENLLLFASTEGVTKLLQLDDTLTLRQSNKLDGHVMASPIAVDGQLYLRTDTHLYRIDGR